MSEGKKALKERFEKEIKNLKKDLKRKYDVKYEEWLKGRIYSLESVLGWIEIEL